MTQPVPPPEELDDGLSSGQVNALLVAAEAAIAAAVYAAYTTWLAEVAAKVLAGFVKFGIAPDPAAVWATVPSWISKVDFLITDLMGIARQGWQDAANTMGVDVPFNPTDPILQDTLQRTRNFMVRTPDEVYRMILRAIDAHPGDINAQAQAVQNVLDATGTEDWRNRAQTVAVTEVHRAWNMGGFALAARFSGTKEWIAKDDSATRPGHRRADGQIVPIMQPFIVSEQALMFPGDPAGSAWNVVNCRCKPRFRRSNGR